MLSTSYQAFYALDTLRDRANLTCRHVACKIMSWDDVTYRAVLRNVESGAKSGLTGRVDIEVRKAIDMLLFGLEEGLLPIPRGRTTAIMRRQNDMLITLRLRYAESDFDVELDDPLDYFDARICGQESFILTESILEHARRFSSRRQKI